VTDGGGGFDLVLQATGAAFGNEPGLLSLYIEILVLLLQMVSRRAIRSEAERVEGRKLPLPVQLDAQFILQGVGMMG